MYREYEQLAEESEHGISAVRAHQAWLYLIAQATQRRLPRYKELADIMGYEGSSSIGRILGPIAYFCRENDLPPLSIIVVGEDGKPGIGFTIVPPHEIDKYREKTYQFPWYSIMPPSVKALAEAYERGLEEDNTSQKSA